MTEIRRLAVGAVRDRPPPMVIYLMSRSPQSTPYLFLSILALACDCSLHRFGRILSLTTSPQMGQKRTGGFASRWFILGQGVMFIVIPKGRVAGFKRVSRYCGTSAFRSQRIPPAANEARYVRTNDAATTGAA